MKEIRIDDTTLCREKNSFGFKEKIEIARLLSRLCVNTIELPEIVNERADTLLIRTLSSFIKDMVISVAAGIGKESLPCAIKALNGASKPRVRIELPVSPVGMEYTCHKKPDKMLALIPALVREARDACPDVEFCAEDATRAEPEFLRAAVSAAVEAGATSVCLCDSAGNMMPDCFADFASDISALSGVPVAVRCENGNGLAVAQAALAVKKGVCAVKTAVGGHTVPLDIFGDMVKNCGPAYGFTTGLRYTELHRITGQILCLCDGTSGNSEKAGQNTEENAIVLSGKDSKEQVMAASCALGYDLTEEDGDRVYAEFCRVAEKKNVGAAELDAIISNVALQVPPTYLLQSYIVNNGNLISTSAQITLEHNGKTIQGVALGNGPIDASFLALEQIIGHHYELDDFRIESVTEGKEAMGKALVKLRADGKLYSGNGLSTDIIGAGIRAYLCAVNKIAFEEAQV